MNVKRIIPGLLAALILFTASAANAGGGHSGNWSFSINWHGGTPSYHVNVAPNWHQVNHWRQQQRHWRKRARHQRRHHGNRHRHGHRFHQHSHHSRHHHHGRRGHRKHW